MIVNLTLEKTILPNLQPLKLTDSVVSVLNEKFLPITVLMDLSKAFDTLDHQILLYFMILGN